MNKLLVIGSNSVHTFNFIELVSIHFDDVLLITNERNQEKKVRQEIVSFNLKLSSLFISPSKIRRIVIEYNPTIVHVHQANSYALYAALAIGKRANTVLTAWGSDIFILPKKNFFWGKFVRFYINKFNYFTADSINLAEELKELLVESKEVLVANFGIELFQIEKEKENLFYSNRLHKPLYRVATIIYSFHTFRLKNSTTDWRLVIGATGTETENLKKIVRELHLGDSVEFIGWVDSETNRNWYARSTFWISIPESDATSISLLEAMAYGCIPILSDLPSNREWIKDKINGSIVAELDADFLTPAFDLDREKVRSMNQIIIQKDGTKEANRKKFISLYEKIINSQL
jgi:glycosyltransferase involved in cell wall biosynthesis